jgi:hypothetical protein
VSKSQIKLQEVAVVTAVTMVGRNLAGSGALYNMTVYLKKIQIARSLPNFCLPHEPPKLPGLSYTRGLFFTFY